MSLPLVSPAALVVRPERIAVGAAGVRRAPGRRNVLDGAVLQVIYLGANRKIEVELADARVIIARESEITGDAPLPGQAVELSWAAGDATLVPVSQLPGA